MTISSSRAGLVDAAQSGDALGAPIGSRPGHSESRFAAHLRERITKCRLIIDPAVGTGFEPLSPWNSGATAC